MPGSSTALGLLVDEPQRSEQEAVLSKGDALAILPGQLNVYQAGWECTSQSYPFLVQPYEEAPFI